MALRYPIPSAHTAWALGDGYRTSIFYYIKRQSAQCRATRHSIFFGDR